MQKDEIRIGACYAAKVANRTVVVRIDSVHSRGGWNATNATTGRRMRIKSPQWLLAEEPAGAPEKTAAKPPRANPTVAIVTGQPVPKAKRAGPSKKAAKPKSQRRSALDAAAEVLATAEQPLQAGELIRLMTERRLWSSPNGKTPAATLYAAMLREINAKGATARFRRVDRGRFAATETTAPPR